MRFRTASVETLPVSCTSDPDFKPALRKCDDVNCSFTRPLEGLSAALSSRVKPSTGFSNDTVLPHRGPDRTCRIWSQASDIRRIFRVDNQGRKVLLDSTVRAVEIGELRSLSDCTIFGVDRECFLVPILPTLFGVEIMVTVEEYRLDKDSMGEVKVPSSAYYGAEPNGPFRTSPYRVCVFLRNSSGAMAHDQTFCWRELTCS